MQTLKRIVIGAVIGAALMFAWNWRQEGIFSAELKMMRNQNAEQRQKLDGQIEAATKAADEAKAAIEAQHALQASLREKDKLLLQQEAELVAERQRRLIEIPDLPIASVVERTLAELDLEPPEISVTEDGFARFSEFAAKSNLEHLIVGASAQGQVGVCRERIGVLTQQNSSLGLEIEQTNELRSAEETACTARLEKKDLTIAELKKEIQMRKARARKRGFLAYLAGVLSGLFLGR